MSVEGSYKKLAAANLDRVDKYVARLKRLFAAAYSKYISLATSVDYDKSLGQFFFDNYPELRREADKVARELALGMEKVIVTGTTAEWTRGMNDANGVIDYLLQRAGLSTKDDSITGKIISDSFNNRQSALEAFQQRRIKGMSVSERVWDISKQNKLESELARSIAEGTSANEIADSMKGLLKKPNELYRRVRDEFGTLQLSKNARAYNPGAGVYRSSFKNAQRLARTEINMAYRNAELESYRQDPDVVGFEIKRSNHPYDCPVCEALKGKYPKTFKWNGWHPNCRCYMVPILLTEDEFMESLDDDNFDPTTSENYVKDVPDNFDKFVFDNAARIEKAKSQGTLPYFLEDNFSFTREGMSEYRSLVNEVKRKTALVDDYRYRVDDSPVLVGLYSKLDSVSSPQEALSIIKEIQHKAAIKTRWELRKYGRTDGLDYVGEKFNYEVAAKTEVSEKLIADLVRYRDPDTGLVYGYQIGYPAHSAYSASEASKQVLKIPEIIHKDVKSIDFLYLKNPQDAYWEKTYGIKGFISEATDGSHIKFWSCYPDSSGNKDFLRVMSHESGHLLDGTLGITKFSDFSNKNNDWWKICELDSKISKNLQYVTAYARDTANLGEDFAESVMYFVNHNDWFKKTFPNRFKFINDIVHGREIRLSSSLGNELPYSPSKQSLKRKHKTENKKLYESLKKDSRFTDVKYNSRSGGVKATEIGHNKSSIKEKRFFATDTFAGYTGKQLEEICQDRAFNSGFSLIFANEGKAIGGKKLTSLDCWFNGERMDIASATSGSSNNIRNILNRKNRQIADFNARFDITEKSDSLLLFFYDGKMFSDKVVISGVKGYLDFLRKKKIKNHIKEIHCLVSEGKGVRYYSFSI